MNSQINTSGFSLAIAGVAGRMGRQLVGAALDAGLTIAGGTEQPASAHVSQDIGELAGRGALGLTPSTDLTAAAGAAEVWIDFTVPAATLEALDALASTPVRCVVIGTTGFTPEQEKQIAAAAEHMAIVKAGNFSVGVNVLEALTRMAASRLGEGWDIEILETHHRRKVDAPSGTALMLGEAAAEGRSAPLSALRADPRDGADALRDEGSIGFAVRRSGGVIGEHEVSLASDQEVITLSHSAIDRAVFATGAIRAAIWLRGRAPGLYGMDDVLGLKA